MRRALLVVGGAVLAAWVARTKLVALLTKTTGTWVGTVDGRGAS